MLGGGNASPPGADLSNRFISDQGEMAEELKPIANERKSLAELAYEATRERILSGFFKPGDWLRQEGLSKQLAVSHTPVREALDRLVADGLAERVPDRGVRVSAIDENDIAEVYCLRLLLEPLIVRLTALNISREELDHLKTIVDQAEKLTSLDDMPARRQLNRDFHSTICITCGSGTLKRLHKIVWDRFPEWMFYEGLYRKPDTLKSRLRREITEHRAMLNAISKGNVDRAEQISISHIKGMKEDLLEVFEIPSHIIEEKQQQMGLMRMPPDV